MENDTDPVDDPFSLTNQVEDRIFGSIMVLYTVAFVGPYMACLYVLGTDTEMKVSPCYRIIFHIGVADVIQGITNGIGGGVFSIIRMAPHEANKRVGSVLEGCWMAYSILVNLLAFNRFIQVCFSSKATQVFTKRATTVMVVICWIYGLTAFIVYNTEWVSVVYYPEMYLWGYDGNQESIICGYVEEALDLLQLLCMIIWYIAIFVRLKVQKQQIHTSSSRGQINKKELRVVVQSMLICCLYFATCFGFFAVPQITGNNRYATFVCDLIWLTNCGVNPIIYMTFNLRLRRKIFRLFGKGMVPITTMHQAGRSVVSANDMRRGSNASRTPSVFRVGDEQRMRSVINGGTAIVLHH